jgi:hypothetical protein
MHALLVESLHLPVCRSIARLTHGVSCGTPQAIQLEGIVRNTDPLDKTIPSNAQEGKVGRASKRLDRFAARVDYEI